MEVNKMKASVSFKATEKDIWDHLNNQLSISIYIKQLIIKDMKTNKEEPDTSRVVTSKNNSALSLDF